MAQWADRCERGLQCGIGNGRWPAAPATATDSPSRQIVVLTDFFDRIRAAAVARQVGKTTFPLPVDLPQSRCTKFFAKQKSRQAAEFA
jgi:hypothetical protein